MTNIPQSIAKRLGYTLIKTDKINNDGDLPDPIFENIYQECQPYTMTSRARMKGLYNAVKYVVERNIPGDIVECGVWRGGSSMLAALTLLEIGATQRLLYLYDTYEGMTEPTEHDVDFKGNTAQELLNAEQNHDDDQDNIWAYASIDIVRRNLFSTGFAEDQMMLIKGPVEETIPETMPDQISILRLDTDWYASTYHELVYLYPKLAPGGVLIIDDYGHWNGSRKAVDQYFSENDAILLHPLDYSGRIGVKA
jgi:O-methyltransferase